MALVVLMGYQRHVWVARDAQLEDDAGAAMAASWAAVNRRRGPPVTSPAKLAYRDILWQGEAQAWVSTCGRAAS